MPERLASTSPYQPVKDVVGSGPHRFLPNEHISGAGAAFARFAEYQPRHGHPEPTLRRGYEASDLIHYRPSIASSANFDASPCSAIGNGSAATAENRFRPTTGYAAARVANSVTAEGREARAVSIAAARLFRSEGKTLGAPRRGPR
jgi:hypothetical protein